VSSFRSENPDAGLLGLLLLSNLCYFAAIIALIVLLAKSTDPEPNRYGEPPEA
jgi:hypothetical protein